MFSAADVGYCPVKLGMMSNRLQSGVNSLQGFREDKRNRITQGIVLLQLHASNLSPLRLVVLSCAITSRRRLFPAVSYINYGPFTSYAPTYDSSFANISKEDSDLIYSSYGDESSLQGSERYARARPQTHCSSGARTQNVTRGIPSRRLSRCFPVSLRAATREEVGRRL